MKLSKILVLGNKGVGKSSFLKNYKGLSFSNHYIPDNNAVVTSFNGEINFIEINDREELINHLEDVDLIFLLFDVTEPYSFHELEYWIELIEDFRLESKFVLIGTKVDIKNRVVKPSIIKKFLEIKKYKISYTEISFLTGYNTPKLNKYIESYLNKIPPASV